MATLSDLITELETDLDAISPGTRLRMTQDYGDESPEFAALGETLYQIRASLLNYVYEDSGAPKVVAQVEVFFHHAVATFAGDQTYQSGQMGTDQLAVLDPEFWRNMASVYSVIEDTGPVVNDLPERTGKRVTYSIAVQLALAP